MSDSLETIRVSVNEHIDYLKGRESQQYVVHMGYEPSGQDDYSLELNLPLKDVSLWLDKHNSTTTTDDEGGSRRELRFPDERAAVDNSRSYARELDESSSDDLMDEPRTDACDIDTSQSPSQDDQMIESLKTRVQYFSERDNTEPRPESKQQQKPLPTSKEVSDTPSTTLARLQNLLQEYHNDEHKVIVPMRLLQDIVQEDITGRAGREILRSSQNAIKDKELKTLSTREFQYASRINKYLRIQLTSILRTILKEYELLHAHASAGPLLLVSPHSGLAGQRAKTASLLRYLIELYWDVDAALTHAYLQYSIVDSLSSLNMAPYYRESEESDGEEVEGNKFSLARAESVFVRIKDKVKHILEAIPLGAHYPASAEDEDFQVCLKEVRKMVVW